MICKTHASPGSLLFRDDRCNERQVGIDNRKLFLLHHSQGAVARMKIITTKICFVSIFSCFPPGIRF